MTEFIVRSLERRDCAQLLELVRALAIHHGYVDHLLATADMYESEFFKSGALIGAIVAEVDGKIAGCAIWHRSFSTFRGTEVMYLEDLSVLPEYRSRGIGLSLMKSLARLAKEQKLPSIFWIMMGWNTEARDFYHRLGAEIEANNCVCRLHGAALEALAHG